MYLSIFIYLINIMEQQLSKISKNLISLLSNFKISFKNTNDYSILLPYFNRMKDKFKECNNYTILEKNEKSILKKDKHSKTNMFYIFSYLRNNKEILDKYLINFSEKEKVEVNRFLNNIDVLDNEKKAFFLSYNKKFIRLLNNLIKNRNLPEEILNRFSFYNEHIYGEFSNLEIQNSFEKEIDSEIKILAKLKNIYLDLNCKSNGKINDHDLDLIIKRCLILANYHDVDYDKNNPIKIELVLTSEKKMMPKIKSFGPKQINSGSTIFYGSGFNEVCLWRKEEHRKVIIHELIHHHNIDFHDKTYNYKISENFDIDKEIEIRVYEAYTEVIANIINCMLCSLEINTTNPYLTFKKFMKHELKFGLYQVSKILTFLGYKSVYEFVNINAIKTNRFKQTTSVFSYFFVKVSLLFSLDNLISFIENNSNNYFKLNNDDKIVGRNFMELILKTTLNNNYLLCVDKFMKKQRFKTLSLRKNNFRKTKIKKNKRLLKNTLRMTVIETK